MEILSIRLRQRSQSFFDGLAGAKRKGWHRDNPACVVTNA